MFPDCWMLQFHARKSKHQFKLDETISSSGLVMLFYGDSGGACRLKLLSWFAIHDLRENDSLPLYLPGTGKTMTANAIASRRKGSYLVKAGWSTRTNHHSLMKKMIGSSWSITQGLVVVPFWVYYHSFHIRTIRLASDLGHARQTSWGKSCC